MSLVLNVEILGEFKNLTAATTGATSKLNGLNKTAKNVSNKMNAAFAAIGVGFSLNAIISGLENAGKAAVADVKSMDLLALAMKNTGSATDDTVTAAEKYISKMQTTVGIADDDLRPAYQKLFLSTKDVTKANDLLAIALDVSAGSGKDLDVVAQAMAKSLEGNNTALEKLVPSVKGSKTPIEDMGKAFAGAAASAAQNDPFKTLTIIFGDMQEKVGLALLPTLADFSKWLATPEGQQKLQDIVDGLILILNKATELVEWVGQNADWLAPMIGAIGGLTAAWKIAKGAVDVYNTAAAIAAGSAVTGVLGTLLAIGGNVAAILSIPGSTAIGAEKPLESKINPTLKPGTAPLIPTTGVPNAPTSSFSKITGGTNNTTININTPKMTASEVVNLINKNQMTGGVARLLR